MAHMLAPDIKYGGSLCDSVFASPALLNHDKGAQLLVSILHTCACMRPSSSDASCAESICRALAAAATATTAASLEGAGERDLGGGGISVRRAQMALVCLLWHALKRGFVALIHPWLPRMVEAAVDMTASAGHDGADKYAQQMLATLPDLLVHCASKKGGALAMGEVLMTATRIAMTSEDWQQRHAAAVLLRDLALSCRLAGASCEAAQEAGPGEEAPAGSGAQGLPGMRAQEWARHATRAADVLCEMLNDVIGAVQQTATVSLAVILRCEAPLQQARRLRELAADLSSSSSSFSSFSSSSSSSVLELSAHALAHATHLPLALRWALAQASRRLGAAPQSVALLAMRHVRALILEVAVFKERYARALGMDCADSDSDALLADTAADLSYIS